MSSVDLVFDSGRDGGPPWELLFDGDALFGGAIDCNLGVLSFEAEVDVGVAGYFKAKMSTPWAAASTLSTPLGQSWGEPAPAKATLQAAFSDGISTSQSEAAVWGDGVRSVAAADGAWREAAPVGRHRTVAWKAAAALLGYGGGTWKGGVPLVAPVPSLPWRAASKLKPAYRAMPSSQGRAVLPAVRAPWTPPTRRAPERRLPWRDASQVFGYGGRIVPVPPVVPPEVTCYVASSDLVFSLGYTQDSNLVFSCDYSVVGGVVVPRRTVYYVTNTITLQLVSDGRYLVFERLSLSIDRDSWSWSFSASLPGGELGYLSPTTGSVELLATVNGTAIRLVGTDIGTTRVFGKKGISLSGRGRIAVLGAPYSPVKSFTNASTQTAAQIMESVLTEGAVSIGWAVDFSAMDDWAVPAGVWVHKGTYMEALIRIASAAGGYIQPHNTAQELKVLPDYPVAPWNWAGLTPDFVIPEGPVSVEGIEYKDMPLYDRVYISGEKTPGKLVQITVTGEAGTRVAPMFVDALIVDQIPAITKGRSILGNTGRQAIVSLKLPVLPGVGIIMPGKYVEYDDGTSTYFGISRSTSLEVTNQTTLWQTIKVETHV